MFKKTFKILRKCSYSDCALCTFTWCVPLSMTLDMIMQVFLNYGQGNMSHIVICHDNLFHIYYNNKCKCAFQNILIFIDLKLEIKGKKLNVKLKCGGRDHLFVCLNVQMTISSAALNLLSSPSMSLVELCLW